jgi:carbonic anhydrase
MSLALSKTSSARPLPIKRGNRAIGPPPGTRPASPAYGGLAILGVFMAPGGANAVFNKIVSTVPAEEGPPVPADPAIDPNGLLPARYRDEGSLTPPPSSETVDWLVFADGIEVSEADIARFAKLYPMNARPVQNRNRRFILSTAQR